MTDRVTDQLDDIAYLRQREADERAAAEDAACMARTAHEDMADEYADRAEDARRAREQAGLDHESLLKQIDGKDRP